GAIAPLAQDDRRIALAETLGRAELDARTDARLEPGERRLDLREEIAVAAVQVIQCLRRWPLARLVDHLDAQRDHRVLLDLHRRAGGRYSGLIFAAAGPFCPCVTSKETFWPSLSVRWPAP